MSMSTLKHKTLYSWCTKLSKFRGPVLVQQVARTGAWRKKGTFVECQLSVSPVLNIPTCHSPHWILPCSLWRGKKAFHSRKETGPFVILCSGQGRDMHIWAAKSSINSSANLNPRIQMSAWRPGSGGLHFKKAASNLTLPLQLLSDGTPFHKSWHVKKIIVNYFTYLLCFGFPPPPFF